MTTYELLDLYRKVFHKVENLNGYTEDLITLVNNVTKYSNSLINIVYSSDFINSSDSIESIENLKNAIIKLMTEFTLKFDVLNNHGKLIQMEKDLIIIMSNFPPSLEDEKNKIIDLINSYSTVTSIIIDCLKTKTSNKIVKLINASMTCINQYKDIIQNYKSIENFILKTENKIAKNENEEILKLQFYDEHIDPEYFIRNIEGIRDTYKHICQVFKISLSDHELKVLKIESGSLLVKIIGDASVIASLGFLLKKITELIFNKFTFEGKVLRHKQLLDLVIKDVEIIEKYKSLGYDISFEEDTIKYHYQILKSISKLVVQSTKIKIDDHELALEDKLKQRYLTESKTLLIEDSLAKKDDEKGN